MSDSLPPRKFKTQKPPAAASPRSGKELPSSAGHEIIPVGHEPRRRPEPNANSHREAAGRKVGSAREPAEPHQRKKGRRNLRDPGKFFSLKGRLNALSIFTLQTMGTLRRSEIRVWLAIFNCEFNGLARIGYSRLCEITHLSRRHVGTAVKSLEKKGLLEVVLRGRYQPNQSRAGDGSGGGNGFASCYRIHARSELQAEQTALTDRKSARPAPKPKPR